MLTCLLETTSDLQPHTYLVDQKRGKMLAYRRCDNGEIKVFSRALSFSKSHRKFKKVTDQELIDSIETEDK